MKTYFITYRRNGQFTNHTRHVVAPTLKEAIDMLIADCAQYGQTITVLWVN